jgi:alcohol dehydrogenase (cytochrome c)
MFHPKSPDQMGEIQAMNMRDGKPLWSQRRRAPFTTSALATGGGLVFIGGLDRFVFAYDASTGSPLWQARLTTMANGFPITYSVDGKQYIAFGAGSGIPTSSWTTRVPPILLPEIHNPSAGNAIFVFALPGN